MTSETIPPTADEDRVLGPLSGADLNGHTVDELADYYDAGLTPADPSIDASAGCRITLAAIGRLRTLTEAILEEDALRLPPLDDSWVTGIVTEISRQAPPGPDPVILTGPRGGAGITEDDLRDVVRATGDQLPGLLTGRITLAQGVAVPGSPLTVHIDAAALWGANIPESAEQLQRAVDAALRTQTRLNIVAIDVTVTDVQRART